MTLNVNSRLCHQTERLMLKSRGYRYKVALYLSYLHIKFLTTKLKSEVSQGLIHWFSLLARLVGEKIALLPPASTQ